MALYEAKLESVPEEYFADVQFVPPVQQQDIMVRTENPLLQIQTNVNVNPVAKIPAKDEAKKQDTKAEEKQNQGFVPPPPENGQKIIAPIGMPAVKTFPISKTAPPAGMSFPNLASAASVPPGAS